MDISEISDMLNDYSIKTGMAIDLIEKETGELLIAAGFSELCFKFHASSPKSGLLCKRTGGNIDSDSGVELRGCEIGMTYGMINLNMDGVTMAELHMGPVLFTEPSAEKLEQYLANYAVDEEWLNMYLQVPVMEKNVFCEYMLEIAAYIPLIAGNAHDKH